MDTFVRRLLPSGMAIVAVAFSLALAGAAPAGASAGATIVVDITSDTVNANDGHCSLREAITAANTNAASGTEVGECPAGASGLDHIEIEITGGGLQTLALASQLPDIVKPVIIDASTESGASAPAIILDGGGTLGDGFVFQPGSAGSKLIGFRIANFLTSGVNLLGGKVTLQQNWIGTPDGTTASQPIHGVYVNSSGNIIGLLDSTFPTQPSNVISGTQEGVNIFSGTGTIIQSNYLGTTADGSAALGTPAVGVHLQDNTVKSTQIGGPKANQGNLISGNVFGVFINPGVVGTRIVRNMIGTNALGTSALTNTVDGILDQGGIGTVIGGPTMASANLISGNTTITAVAITGGSASKVTVQNNIIGLGATGGALGNGWGILTNNQPHVTIKSNLVAHSIHIGVSFNSGVPTVSGSSGNCIFSNGVAAYTDNANPIPFTKNWWGSASDPSGQVTGPFTLSPWLTTPPAICNGWAPVRFTPADQAFANKSTKDTKLSWGAVPTASDYHVTLSQNQSLTSPLIADSSTGGKPYLTDLSGPLDFGRYYWQVTTYTADHFVWAGPINSFYVTLLKSPKPGASVKSGAVKFMWNAYTPAANGYTWAAFSTPDCTTTPDANVTPNSNASAMTTTQTATVTSGTHYWTVSVNGGPAAMPCWSFVVP